MGQNKLYPVFLKLENLHTVLVGAGDVGLEKLTALLKNSPNAKVTIIAEKICKEIKSMTSHNENIRMLKKNLLEDIINVWVTLFYNLGNVESSHFSIQTNHKYLC